MKPPHSYISYLLRMWRSGESEPAVWRASLEDPMTGQRQGFHSLPDLFAFLKGQSRSAHEQKPIRAEQAEAEEGGEAL